MTPNRTVGIIQIALGIALLLFWIPCQFGLLSQMEPKRSPAIAVVGLIALFLGIRSIRRAKAAAQAAQAARESEQAK